MLDPKFIRQNPEIVRAALNARGASCDLDAFLALDKDRRGFLSKLEEAKAGQNRLDDEIKAALQSGSPPADKLAVAKELKKGITTLEASLKDLEIRFNDELDRIPNVPQASVPAGGLENNQIIRTWGEPRNFAFKPMDHLALAEYLDIVDFKRGVKISGSNFVVFKKDGARLTRALINFMLDLHTGEHGYKEIMPPLLVNRASMRATGQLPKLEEDMYRVEKVDLFLIPTAEVPVTNLHRDEILREEDLPVYYAAYTPCFRLEAGSYGKDTKGLMRVHQFDKVELVKFVRPETSGDEHEKLLNNACKVLELLEIPYRVALLAAGDMSFAAAKCYDIEIHSPGIDRWLEVSSCSNFEDFQARRGGIRYKNSGTGKNEFVHTLNGSGVALARLVAAILENHQQPDGTVAIPQVLRRYWDGRDKIQK